MTTQTRQAFIAKSRQLADQLIKVSDAFNALYAEAEISGLLLPPEYGGLGGEDFVGAYADLDADTLRSFYNVVGGILQPLTLEQKKTIYHVRHVQAMPGMYPPV